MRARRLLTAAAVATTAVLVPLGTPAEAAVVTSTLGTSITATVTGDATIAASCIGNLVAINGAVPVPPVPCATFNLLTVNGDGGRQFVSGSTLDTTTFPAGPKLTVALGDGNDNVYESRQADDLDLGPGDDFVTLEIPGATNTEVDLGAGADTVSMLGTFGDDAVTIASNGPDASLLFATGQGPVLKSVKAVEDLSLQTISGDDTVTSTAVTLASALDLFIVGGDGDDTFTTGPTGALVYGGRGTNTFNGSTGSDRFVSESETDVVHLAGGSNFLTDETSLRSGGRTIDSSSTTDGYTLTADEQDATVRLRPGLAVGSARLTTSLHRTGQQQVPSTFNAITVGLSPYGDGPDRGLVDVVSTRQSVTVYGDASDDDLLDLTIPVGSWTSSVIAGGKSTVDPSNAAYGSVTFNNTGRLYVHGPWTDAGEGFGHRVIRDLQFRFATVGERQAIRDALTGGTKTRPQVIAGLVDTDLYRGLDVDRTFVDFLGRQADPSGRTYWINAIRNGRSLQRFRAELFGSSEYFNKSGATNAAYVRAAYADVLGRLPDPAGQAYWVNKITNGTAHSTVAKQFLNSAEARRAIVEDQYLRFLDRRPTANESTVGMATISATADGEQRLITALASSTAYYQRT